MEYNFGGFAVSVVKKNAAIFDNDCFIHYYIKLQMLLRQPSSGNRL